VASIWETLPTYGDVGDFFGEIYKHLAKKLVFKPAGNPLMICHDNEYKEHDVDVEIAVPIKKSIAGSDRVKVYELPGLEQAACIIHKGPYDTLSETYTALMKWMEKNGYQPDDADRELFLTYDTKNPSKSVTEIQFPVKKINQ
jgi:effector-binding domain-containing protein